MLQKHTLSCYFMVLIAISSFTTIQARFSLEEVKKFSEKCNPVQADLDVVLTYQIPETETGKCLIFCILKAVTTIDANGKFNADNAKKVMTGYWKEFKDDDVAKIIDDCAKIAEQYKDKENTCEYGYHTAKCFQSKMKELKADIYTYVMKNSS